MTNLLIEGFDLYNAGSFDSQTGNPWVVTGSNTLAGTVSTVSPITGTRCYLSSSGSSPDGNITRGFGASVTEVFFGFALNIASTTALNGNRVGPVSATNQKYITFANNRIRVLETNTVATTGLTPLLSGVKYYIEAHFTQTTYEVRINGVVEVSGTWASAPGNFSSFRIGRFSSAGTTDSVYRLDDLYVNSSAGSINNGYMGEVSVLTLFPDADLTPAQWTITGTATGHEALDNVPGTTTDYIQAVNPGDKSRYSIPTIPFDVSDIHVVQTAFRGQKTTSGSNTSRANLAQSGTTANGATQTLLENTYAYFFDSYELDPSTSLAWDPDTFDPELEFERVV